MRKLKQKYVIIAVILLLVIASLIFRRTTYSIKGITLLGEKEKITEIDLGRYKKNEIYDKYPAYIITNNSDFNILRVFGIEVKYPSNLTLQVFVKNKLIGFRDKSQNVIFFIKNDKNEGKKTAKEFFEENKELFENVNSNEIDISQKVEGNKIITTGKSKDKSVSFLNIYEVNNDSIKYLSLYAGNNAENIDSIIDTMKDSCKLKE